MKGRILTWLRIKLRMKVDGLHYIMLHGNGDEDLVKLLMDYGADPSQSDNERHTALHNAEGEHCGIIHILMLNCGPIARHPCANPQN